MSLLKWSKLKFRLKMIFLIGVSSCLRHHGSKNHIHPCAHTHGAPHSLSPLVDHHQFWRQVMPKRRRNFYDLKCLGVESTKFAILQFESVTVRFICLETVRLPRTTRTCGHRYSECCLIASETAKDLPFVKRVQFANWKITMLYSGENSRTFNGNFPVRKLLT